MSILNKKLLVMCLLLALLGRPASAWAEPGVSAQGALLLDAQTGQVLWQHNGEAPLPPASTTKILTALLCLDLAPLERECEVSPQAAAVGESSAGLLAGERFALGELLDAALLKSANDACFAIAEGAVGSEPYFVQLMNVKAQALGAAAASLQNTNGLPDEAHLLSCHDLALLTREAMRRPEFADRVGSQRATMEGGSYNRSLKNTNRLLTMDEHVTGVKTGTTKAAGACLVSSMERDGRSVIAVVLHSGDRYRESLELLNYGIDGFCNVRLVQAGQRLAYWPAGGADEENGGVWLLAAADLWLTLPKEQAAASNLRAEYHFKQLRPGEQAPAGACLGTLDFCSEAGEVLGRVNLLSEAAVQAPGGSGWADIGSRIGREGRQILQILFE